MLRAERAEKTVTALRELYPDAECALDYGQAHELLFATIMSAQTTDANVNRVTRTLFQKYRTVADFAVADPAVFAREIHSTGFFNNKTKNVLGAANRLMEEFGGEVPDTMEDLLKLPGVARKTANVVLGTHFGKAEGVVVDTHIKRVSYRIGLTRHTDPVKVERDLMKCLPRETWIFMSQALIWHGRRVCDARKPQCHACTLASFCQRKGVVS